MAKCAKGGRCNWVVVDRPRRGEANIVLEQCTKCTQPRERKIRPIPADVIIIIVVMVLVAALFWALTNWR